MGRLTWKRDLDGFTDVGLRNGVTVGDAICRLADYEDTGLEPCDYNTVRAAIERAKKAEADLAELIQTVGAMGIDHLRELVQAEKDGRLPDPQGGRGGAGGAEGREP